MSQTLLLVNSYIIVSKAAWNVRLKNLRGLRIYSYALRTTLWYGSAVDTVYVYTYMKNRVLHTTGQLARCNYIPPKPLSLSFPM